MRPWPTWPLPTLTCAHDVIGVDDRLLFEIIAGDEPTALREAATDGAATTFSWYYRLSRAIADARMEGALSRRFAGLPDHRQALVRAQLADLSDIEIVAPKELVPVMSALATVVSPNVLTADAVASALVIDAPIVVSTSPELGRESGRERVCGAG